MPLRMVVREWLHCLEKPHPARPLTLWDRWPISTPQRVFQPVCNDRKQRNSRNLCSQSVLLLFIFATVACSGPMTDKTDPPLQVGSPASSRQANSEYIVSVHQGADSGLLRKLYGPYGVRDITDLGAGQFLIKLQHDPGLATVKQKGLDSGKVKYVQPNFSYRLNRP